MARLPTEVDRPSDVAGYGPPCTMAWLTSTPVPKPFTRSRPAFVSNTGISAAIASLSPSSMCRAMVSWPSIASSTPRNSAKLAQRTSSGWANCMLNFASNAVFGRSFLTAGTMMSLIALPMVFSSLWVALS